MNTSYLRRGALPAAAVLALGLTLSACGNSGSGGSSGGNTVTGGGSTAQAVAEQTWRADYQKAHSGTTINYEEVGSGTGVTNFLSKAYSFAGSDAFLTSDQIASAKTDLRRRRHRGAELREPAGHHLQPEGCRLAEPLG